MSYSTADVFPFPLRNPRPIDCKFLILLLDGEVNTTLCKFLIFMPVEKVPYEATIIALLSNSVVCLISSRTSAFTLPLTKNTFLPSSAASLIILCIGTPCFSTKLYKIRVLPFNVIAKSLTKAIRLGFVTIHSTSSEYFRVFIYLQSSGLYLRTIELILKSARVLLSIKALVVVTCFTSPNIPDKTSL